jgi:serine/threonine protein kinase
MAYLEGVTLKQYLANQGERIPFDHALRILMPVMDALRDVHQAGMLHRDISPDNIYVTHNSQVKLLDFGNARFLLGERSQTFSAVLKTGYSPPEQYRRHGRQGAWTDVYALAATFYRALTGRTPPDAPDRLAHDDLIAPSELGVVIPRRAEQALLKALAVRQEDRFQSVVEFQEEISQIPSPPPPPDHDNDRVWKWASVAAIAVIVAMIALVAYWFITRPKTGSLTVTANVVGTRISIDGQTQSDWLTPHTFPNLKAGSHDVTATKDGCQTASASVGVRAGANDSLQQKLPCPPPQFGALTVRTNVPGATVLVDGKTQSDWVTPYTFSSLPTRTYTITVKKEGYQSVSQNVTVEAGGRPSLDFDLKTQATQATVERFGQLEVSANVQGAKILIDGQTQPGWLTPYTFASLPARSHTVTVMSDGYRTASKTVTIVADQIHYSKFDLDPLERQADHRGKTTVGKSNPNDTGGLVVTSDPPGARIVINGSDTGFLTPHTFTAKPVGSYVVALLKNPFEVTSRSFTVEAGKSVTANLSLSLPVRQFTLKVLEVSEGNPEGDPVIAEVFIDGNSYGPSPVSDNLPAGTHHYKVVAGSVSEQGSFEIQGGVGTLEVRVKIKKP